MSVKGYKRGVPTYTDANGDKYGMFCETKEACVSDDEGITLEQKLAKINETLDDMKSEEYLKLNGGGTVRAANVFPVIMENTSQGGCYTSYKNTSGLLGSIGFSAANVPVFLNGGNQANELLHVGNSYKIHVGEDRPLYTNYVWIDTNE